MLNSEVFRVGVIFVQWQIQIILPFTKTRYFYGYYSWNLNLVVSDECSYQVKFLNV